MYASPVGSDPDGNFHLASIWCGSGLRTDKCEESPDRSNSNDSKTLYVPHAVAVANGCVPGNPGESARCTNEMLAIKTMDGISRSNSGGLYPNGYYWVASKLVTDNVEVSVILIRLMNVLILIVFLCVGNIVLPQEIKSGLNLSFLILLMPLGMFLVASINPSSWSISGLGAYWAFLYGFLTIKDLKKRVTSGIFTVVSGMIALQSRADSAAFVIFVSIAIVFLAYARSTEPKRQITKRLLLPAFMFFPAFFSYIGSTQGSTIYSGFVEGTYARDPFMTTLWNITRLPGIMAGVFGFGTAGGGLGWLDTAMPELVSIGTLFLSSALLVLSLGNRSKLENAVLIGFTSTIFLIPLMVLQNDAAYVGENFQSRYLLPAMIVLFGLFLSRPKFLDSRRISKTSQVVFSVTLSLIYLVAMHTTIRRYVTGNDVVGWNLNQGREWWWNGVYPPMTILFVGAISYAIMVSLVVRDLSVKQLSNKFE